MDGVLLVDKPEGPTSHGIVAQARKQLGIKKIGHAGTLDPMASGLMTLGVGSSTRLLTFLVGLDKTYRATIVLGWNTTSDDAQGDVSGAKATKEEVDLVSEEMIRQALDSQVGTIWQRPSAVSAIKVSGQRAYELVRQGHEVELPARQVTIHRIVVTRIQSAESHWEVDCEVDCSSGTYIRAIARDLGAQLGLGGHLVALRRTRVGPWRVEDAVMPDQITPGALREPADIAREVLPSVDVTEDQARDLHHGKKIVLAAVDGVSPEDPVAVIGPTGRLVAVVSGLGGPTRILVGFPAGEDS